MKKNINEFKYYEDLIENKGRTPDHFNRDQWLMTNDNGLTLAHVAAGRGILPPDWTDNSEDWLVKDKDDLSIAFVAASSHCLEPDWTDKTEDWLIRASELYSLQTIAHLAAAHNLLSENWTKNKEDWLVKDKFDNTVAHYAAKEGHLKQDWTDKPEDWLFKNKSGISIAVNALQGDCFPDVFLKNKKLWLDEDQYGETIAHSAIRIGKFNPDNIINQNDWLKMNNAGETIGFLYSAISAHHHNNPQDLHEYMKNYRDHLEPYMDKENAMRNELQSFRFILGFLTPLLVEIKHNQNNNWTETSDEYAGFLIDHADSMLSKVQIYLLDNVMINDFLKSDINVINFLNEIKDTQSFLVDKKLEVKESLFANVKKINKENDDELKIDSKDFI